MDVLKRCARPVSVAFNTLSAQPKDDMRVFLQLLDMPKVKDLSVSDFNVCCKNACAVLAHPKFRVESWDSVELGETPLPAACWPKLYNATVFLRPLCVHHLKLIEKNFCEQLFIFPQGASEEVVAAASRIAERVFCCGFITFTYQSERDVVLLTAILNATSNAEDSDIESLTLRSDFNGGPLSDSCERAFINALAKVASIGTCFCVELGPEVTRSELAIRELMASLENCGEFCNFALECCTPAAGDSACTVLQLERELIGEMHVTTRPRADGTGPRTDAWMWAAMENATIYADNDNDDQCRGQLKLYGGCDDGGCVDAAMAHRAGDVMGQTNMDSIAIMFWCADTSWMAPFILGFATNTATRTREMRLFARKADPNVPSRDEVQDPAVRAAVAAAGVAIPRLTLQCYLA